MKYTLVFLFLLFLFFHTKAQSVTRQPDENKEHFITRILSKSSLSSGGVYEYSGDSGSVILYFETRYADSSQIQNQASSPFEPRHFGASCTLLHLLYSTDQINYSTHLTDTMNVNTGCCPCWLPATVDSVFFLNIDADTPDELCVVVQRPVLPTCNSISRSEVLFFDDYETFFTTKQITRLHPLTKRSLSFMPHEPVKSRVMNLLKQKGILRE